jgi:hypothetical protein
MCAFRPGDWKYPQTHGIHVYELSQYAVQMEAAFLMAIAKKKYPDDEDYIPVEGAPEICEDEAVDCNPDPAVNLHDGMMVFRSGVEVHQAIFCLYALSGYDPGSMPKCILTLSLCAGASG